MTDTPAPAKAQLMALIERESSPLICGSQKCGWFGEFANKNANCPKCECGQLRFGFGPELRAEFLAAVEALEAEHRHNRAFQLLEDSALAAALDKCNELRAALLRIVEALPAPLEPRPPYALQYPAIYGEDASNLHDAIEAAREFDQ